MKLRHHTSYQVLNSYSTPFFRAFALACFLLFVKILCLGVVCYTLTIRQSPTYKHHDTPTLVAVLALSSAVYDDSRRYNCDFVHGSFFAKSGHVPANRFLAEQEKKQSRGSLFLACACVDRCCSVCAYEYSAHELVRGRRVEMLGDIARAGHDAFDAKRSTVSRGCFFCRRPQSCCGNNGVRIIYRRIDSSSTPLYSSTMIIRTWYDIPGIRVFFFT